MSTRTEVRPESGGGPSGAWFWSLLAVGGAIMAFGIVGALTTGGVRPFALAFWVIALAVIHDAIVAPLEYVVGLQISRDVLGWRRAAVQAALVISGVVVLFSIPFVLRVGAQADNPSLLPGSYGAAVIVVIVLVWIVTGGVLWLAWRRQKRLSSR